MSGFELRGDAQSSRSNVITDDRFTRAAESLQCRVRRSLTWKTSHQLWRFVSSASSVILHFEKPTRAKKSPTSTL